MFLLQEPKTMRPNADQGHKPMKGSDNNDKTLLLFTETAALHVKKILEGIVAQPLLKNEAFSS